MTNRFLTGYKAECFLNQNWPINLKNHVRLYISSVEPLCRGCQKKKKTYRNISKSTKSTSQYITAISHFFKNSNLRYIYRVFD